MTAEQEGLEPDKKARWNLCYADEAQQADLENRKGTIVPFSKLPVLSHARAELPKYFGEKGQPLNAELNVYYDVAKCGIGSVWRFPSNTSGFRRASLLAIGSAWS